MARGAKPPPSQHDVTFESKTHRNDPNWVLEVRPRAVFFPAFTHAHLALCAAASSSARLPRDPFIHKWERPGLLATKACAMRHEHVETHI
jgi:hypothetical protein